MLWKKKTYVLFFVFHLDQLMNALVYVDIEQGIHKVKLKNALNEKRKKLCGFSISMNNGKFLSILPEQKVELKPLFSEE